MQWNQIQIVIEGERDQSHRIYTGLPFLKGYIQSSLPTSKENSLTTLNCKLYTFNNTFVPCKNSQNHVAPCYTHSLKQYHYKHYNTVINPIQQFQLYNKSLVLPIWDQIGSRINCRKLPWFWIWCKPVQSLRRLVEAHQEPFVEDFLVKDSLFSLDKLFLLLSWIVKQ